MIQEAKKGLTIMEPEKSQTKPEVVGHIGKMEITCFPDAKERAEAQRERVVKEFGLYSGEPPEVLRHLMAEEAAWTDPRAPYEEARFDEFMKHIMAPVAASAWDFNGCLSVNRDGNDPEHTFHPELEESIRTEIDRLGSFVIVSALTSEQMAWHMAKEERRALKTGEQSIPKNTIIFTENGRAALLPTTVDGKTVYQEYRNNLRPHQETALNHMKDIVGTVTQTLRELGMVAFVNDQKFSKCTMEGAKNGKDWYNSTLRSILLPYLAKRGASWDGSNTVILDGVQFNVSPTTDTWELEITQGSDKIGKRVARDILDGAITDILNTNQKYALYKIITGGDSVKFGGSDAGLTNPNTNGISFAIQSSERPPSDSYPVTKEAVDLKRHSWPEYVKDEKGVRLAGPGVSPARYMKALAETLPHWNIPTDVMSAAILERIVNGSTYEPTRIYDLSKDLLLYNFPQETIQEQQQSFLRAQPDLPVDAKNTAEMDNLVRKIKEKLGLSLNDK